MCVSDAVQRRHKATKKITRSKESRLNATESYKRVAHMTPHDAILFDSVFVSLKILPNGRRAAIAQVKQIKQIKITIVRPIDISARLSKLFIYCNVPSLMTLLYCLLFENKTLCFLNQYFIKFHAVIMFAKFRDDSLSLASMLLQHFAISNK